ncbi:EAL domain, c-di-GMP-specific phosphodiesterase class I (or its enzymatically inactive variant) [Duganella sacchari]|uniref:EAL domain, c-di-GMP-specific phosphodiesterase class I (Or its enzymatically inactive variant) n=1 Tax=Duganella sacchari TaxID=551987 RepID=A0A1M7RAL2_9BURK|nr:EAL domain-containing protein [Duganella sacchari]SHN43221.1 EAL domain, c-di-GMP-specific phosphodiesterase class I (or its enzymatically inactive variant) [Duganella sacchari]
MNTPPLPDTTVADAPSWAGRRVLVVEDSVVQRGYLVGLLRQLNFGEILEAGDGNEAMQVLERQPSPLYLVLTDLEMPGMDGIELTCQLRERRLTENLIVVSARDPRLLEIIENMACEDTSMGLLGTLLKPVQLDSLTQLLCKAGDRGSDCAPLVPPPLPQASLEELAQALTRKEFVPYFQPKVAMQTGHLKGVEALVRWNHPERGLLAPAHFIDTLEGHPLMADFTIDMVQQVLERILDWQSHGLPPLTVSVNLSADNLADRSFIDRLIAQISASGVKPASLVWEVTETSVMRQLSQALTNMGRLRLMGFGLAMDDFGIGYSSMQQFARCPFTELKIDRAFVNGAAQWPNRHMVLKSALDLGQSLGVATVAEGVETVEDWKLLRDLGCDMAQGYLLAKPMPAEDLVGWIRQDRRRLRALAGDE